MDDRGVIYSGTVLSISGQFFRQMLYNLVMYFELYTYLITLVYMSARNYLFPSEIVPPRLSKVLPEIKTAPANGRWNQLEDLRLELESIFHYMSSMGKSYYCSSLIMHVHIPSIHHRNTSQCFQVFLIASPPVGI